jgi:hypothetical protein
VWSTPCDIGNSGDFSGSAIQKEFFMDGSAIHLNIPFDAAAMASHSGALPDERRDEGRPDQSH